MPVFSMAGSCALIEQLLMEGQKWRALWDASWKHYQNQNKVGQERQVLQLSRPESTYVGLLRIFVTLSTSQRFNGSSLPLHSTGKTPDPNFEPQ